MSGSASIQRANRRRTTMASSTTITRIGLLGGGARTSRLATDDTHATRTFGTQRT